MPLAVSDSDNPRLSRWSLVLLVGDSGWSWMISTLSRRRSSAGSTDSATSTSDCSSWRTCRCARPPRAARARCNELMVPARNASATCGRVRNARAVPTIADPTAGLVPVAAAIITPVVPARRLVDTCWASAVPASAVR